LGAKTRRAVRRRGRADGETMDEVVDAVRARDVGASASRRAGRRGRGGIGVPRGVVVSGVVVAVLGFGARGTVAVLRADPFTSREMLVETLDACVAADPTGVACQSSNGVAIENWDVSAVTDMDAAFKERTRFNADISRWNVGQVRTMYNMFKDAIAFNGAIGAWDVSAVTDMQFMFYNASSFDADISAWNVAGVNNMNFMFGNAVSFNRNITVWPNATSPTARFVDMFSGASAWNAAWGRPGRVTNYDGPASVWRVEGTYTPPSPPPFPPPPFPPPPPSPYPPPRSDGSYPVYALGACTGGAVLVAFLIFRWYRRRRRAMAVDDGKPIARP